jgi:hypothetical protein
MFEDQQTACSSSQALSQQSPQKGFSASQIALVSEQAEMIPWQVI